MYRKTLSFRKTDISNSNVIIMEDKKTQLTNEAGIPVGDNQNSRTTGPRGPELLENVWLLEKLAHFNRERIPERIVHAVGLLTHDESVPYLDYVRGIRGNALAEKVKFADLDHNNDFTRLDKVTDTDRRRRAEKYEPAYRILRGEME